MTKEYHEDTGATLVTYKAGRAFDSLGYPAKFWTCRVVYMHNEIDKTYWVYAVQVRGNGMVADQSSHETEMATLREVNRLLDYLQDLEMFFKEEYGE